MGSNKFHKLLTTKVFTGTLMTKRRRTITHSNNMVRSPKNTTIPAAETVLSLESSTCLRCIASELRWLTATAAQTNVGKPNTCRQNNLEIIACKTN